MKPYPLIIFYNQLLIFLYFYMFNGGSKNGVEEYALKSNDP